MLHAAAACRLPDAPACVRLLLREGAQIEACTSAAAGMVRPLQLASLTLTLTLTPALTPAQP